MNSYLDSLKNSTRSFIDEALTNKSDQEESFEIPINPNKFSAETVESILDSWGIIAYVIASPSNTILISISDIESCDLDKMESHGLI